MVLLICGRCRAGKTTYSQKYENVVHLDEVSQKGRERYPKVKEIVSRCSETEDVVIEGIYETRAIREDLLSVCKQKPKKCIWLDTPEDVLKERMRRNFIVPRHFEPPTYDEGWDEIVVIREGNKSWQGSHTVS